METHPIIWFEGVLTKKAERAGDEWILKITPSGSARAVTVAAGGAEHENNIRENARAGAGIVVEGVPCEDDGSGFDVKARLLAFMPSHDDPDGPETEDE